MEQGLQKPNSQSSDSLDCLFDDGDASSPPKYSPVTGVKEVIFCELLVFIPGHRSSISS